MCREVLDAVVRRLTEMFPEEDGYVIFTNTVETQFLNPVFLVGFNQISEKSYPGGRYLRSNGMHIRYFPGKKTQPNGEIEQVSEMLLKGLEYVTLEEGSLLRGTDRVIKIEDGILDFKVNYNMFLYRQKETEQTMESVNVEKGLVK